MDDIRNKLQSYVDDINNIDIVKISDIPAIELYMDQVTTFMQANLGSIRRFPDDKVLTKTMINNYAKAKLFPPPIKKKYSKNHIMLLILIYHLKSLLSISDINKLLKPVTSTLKVNERSALLEDIYNKFVYLQEKSKENAFNSIEDILDDKEINNFTSKTQEQVKYIVIVLFLAIQANKKRKTAEKILDLNF